MGYGPTAIGLSYIPQTIAFLVGGYGCRALLQKWSGQQMLPWLLVIFAVSVAATWLVGLQTHASLVALMIPFCMMAVVNGGIYPIVVAQALKPFPQATGARGGAAKYPAAWPVLPDQSAGIRADRHAAADHHQRNAGFDWLSRNRLSPAADAGADTPLFPRVMPVARARTSR